MFWWEELALWKTKLRMLTGSGTRFQITTSRPTTTPVHLGSLSAGQDDHKFPDKLIQSVS